MSNEFEEIVLKKLEKLDALDERTKNTDKVIEEVILKKLEKLDALDERTKNTDKVIEEVILKKLEKLDALDERTKNTDKVIEEVILKKLEKLDTVEEEMNIMKKELKSTQESIQSLNDRFTVFDFEINKKIDTLFDAITVNNEKHDLFEKSIVSLNTKTFNHDIRISVLEDYYKNSKIFATT